MSGRRSPRRAAHAVVLLAVLSLAGCTGDGEAAAFERAFRGDAAVQSVDLTSGDNQPFSGGVSGEVIARDDIRDEEFTALAARIGDYTRENGERMRGRVSLVADGFGVLIVGNAAADEAATRLLLVLRGDDRVDAVTIEESALSVVAVGAGEAVDVARDLPASLNGAVSERVRFVSVRTDDRAVDLAGAPSSLRSALALWDAVGASVPLSGIRLRDTGDLTLTLAREADLDRARDAAGAAPVRFASELIRLGDSDGGTARSLVARLDASVLARISSVWASDTRLQIAVRTAADAVSLAPAIETALPAGLTAATVVVDGDSETRMTLAPPATTAPAR